VTAVIPTRRTTPTATQPHGSDRRTDCVYSRTRAGRWWRSTGRFATNPRGEESRFHPCSLSLVAGPTAYRVPATAPFCAAGCLIGDTHAPRSTLRKPRASNFKMGHRKTPADDPRSSFFSNMSIPATLATISPQAFERDLLTATPCPQNILGTLFSSWNHARTYGRPFRRALIHSFSSALPCMPLLYHFLLRCFSGTP
jgi:hypothetical protein